jgi:membrane-associated protein
VVFAETGLFFGFFLPGDYLLFLAGMFVATNKLDVGIITMIISLIIAATLGNFVGYWFGYRTGPMLYKRKDSFFFKQKYLVAAEEYYKKQGAFTLIIGRFVPIVRTFAPIFAGVVKLDFKKFAIYNISGAVLWIASLTLLGYFLGMKFEKQVNQNLSYIIIGFIVITTIPLITTFLKKNLKK